MKRMYVACNRGLSLFIVFSLLVLDISLLLSCTFAFIFLILYLANANFFFFQEFYCFLLFLLARVISDD